MAIRPFMMLSMKKRRQRTTRLAYRSIKRNERFGNRPRKMRPSLGGGLIEQWSKKFEERQDADANDDSANDLPAL